MILRDVFRKTAPLIAAAGLLLCLMSPLAQAQAQADTTLSSWEQLTPEQRDELINPLRERWNSQPEARDRILRNARRWQQLTPEQRTRARKGLSRLEQMTPEQRQQAREAYQRMQEQKRGTADDGESRNEQPRRTSPQQRRQRILRRQR